jgi:hypothetical protein
MAGGIDYIDIPTWDNGVETTTTFDSREDFYNYIFINVFKIPGEYGFNETTNKLFNSEAQNFNKNKVYCTAPFKSKDFIKYWDYNKLKNRKGYLIVEGDKHWYLTRDYFMWLNYLPIFDKEEQDFGFAKIRDAQYHMALYELLAELNYEHAAILKKRQIASSYFHAGKILNQVWFEKGVTLKMGASLKDYINEKGTWKFLDEYAAFLNEHTAWYRPMNPSKVLMWQQKIESRKDNRKIEKGLKGTIQGMSFEKDPTNGVGGPVKYFFHEEAGIAPKMDLTYGYIKPALKSGMITTGLFIAAGSVGNLDQCVPLKRMINDPEANQIYAVKTNLLDEDGTVGWSGLFIPEQWSMPPYIDDFGNSLVKEALKALDNHFEKIKKNMEPADYQLEVSQHPRNIAEAFAYRKESKFPAHLVNSQIKKVEDKLYPYELLDLSRNATGQLVSKSSNRLPITEFPISKKTEDKTGCLIVWERPPVDPGYGMFYASIDPVAEGKTTTSDSLCSIYIMKAPVEVTKVNGGEAETHVEQSKIVAAWCGRFDDINKTHERLELIIEWYNARAVVENNISQFINYMIFKKKQKYLVPRTDILFLKELGANASVHQEYGWRNTGTLFKNHMLSYTIEYLKEELDVVQKEDGTVVKVTYGIERIPDIMLLKEMQAYVDGLNVDRLVAFSALVSYLKIQEANLGYQKRVIMDEASKNLQKSQDLYKLNKSPFKHMGSAKTQSKHGFKRSAFKNLK